MEKPKKKHKTKNKITTKYMCVRECVSIRCLISVQEFESIAEKAYKSFSKPFMSFFEIFIAYYDQTES